MKNCKQCHKLFTWYDPRMRFCSKRCAKTYNNKRSNLKLALKRSRIQAEKYQKRIILLEKRISLLNKHK